MQWDREQIKKRAGEIKEIQVSALQSLAINDKIVDAIIKIIEIRNKGGHIITTGMGKAGIIAYKMSATLSSIGFPSYFVSPAEAAHGDLGRITPDDLVIVFSNSGKTGEVVNMIHALHNYNKKKNFIISIGSAESPIYPTDLVISYGKVSESCVVKKVPSTSTTVMLLIADILAITAAEAIGLNDEWFKIRHPGGAIGQSYREEEKKKQ